MTNTGNPLRFITRLGNGWTMRMLSGLTGENLYRREIDRAHGGREESLRAIQKIRDKLEAKHRANGIRRKPRSNAKSRAFDLPAGVMHTYCKDTYGHRRARFYAIHPEDSSVTKSFSYDGRSGRTLEDARYLAIASRQLWEKEIGVFPATENALPLTDNLFIVRQHSGWYVKIPINDKSFVDEHFSDSMFDDNPSLSLKRAEAFCEKMLVGLSMNNKRAIPPAPEERDSRLLTGVLKSHYTSFDTNGGSIIVKFVRAVHPEDPRIKKTFNYRDYPSRRNQRTLEEAINLANQQRKKWENT